MPPKKKAEKASSKAKGEANSKAAAEETAIARTPAEQLVSEGIITTFALSSKVIHRNVRDIHVENLTVTFHGSPIIEEAELSLNYGNRYGYIGPFFIIYKFCFIIDFHYFRKKWLRKDYFYESNRCKIFSYARWYRYFSSS
jgi:hypothetical protein